MNFASVFATWCIISGSCQYNPCCSCMILTRDGVCWVRAAEDPLGPHNSKVGYGNEDVVWSEDHNHLAWFAPDAIQTQGQSFRPLQQRSWCQVLIGIFGVDPNWCVRRRCFPGKQIIEEVAFWNVKYWEWRRERHCDGGRGREWQAQSG